VSTARICVLMLLFACVALGVVYLRVEQTRCAAAALRLEAERTEARHELWRVQTSVARLRSPERLHGRMSWIKTNLVAPTKTDPVLETAWSATRPRG